MKKRDKSFNIQKISLFFHIFNFWQSIINLINISLSKFLYWVFKVPIVSCSLDKEHFDFNFRQLYDWQILVQQRVWIFWQFFPTHRNNDTRQPAIELQAFLWWPILRVNPCRLCSWLICRYYPTWPYQRNSTQ